MNIVTEISSPKLSLQELKKLFKDRPKGRVDDLFYENIIMAVTLVSCFLIGCCYKRVTVDFLLMTAFFWALWINRLDYTKHEESFAAITTSVLLLSTFFMDLITVLEKLLVIFTLKCCKNVLAPNFPKRLVFLILVFCISVGLCTDRILYGTWREIPKSRVILAIIAFAQKMLIYSSSKIIWFSELDTTRRLCDERYGEVYRSRLDSWPKSMLRVRLSANLKFTLSIFCFSFGKFLSVNLMERIFFFGSFVTSALTIILMVVAEDQVFAFYRVSKPAQRINGRRIHYNYDQAHLPQYESVTGGRSLPPRYSPPPSYSTSETLNAAQPPSRPPTYSESVVRRRGGQNRDERRRNLGNRARSQSNNSNLCCIIFSIVVFYLFVFIGIVVGIQKILPSLNK